MSRTNLSMAATKFPQVVYSAILALLLLLLPSCTASEPITTIRPEQIPPRLTEEFRGAWIASAGNIDWPSKPGLTVAEQKTELLALLNRAVELRLNAIFFQVRPACDALYRSEIEPWSFFLTGKIGADGPDYDPLAFAVEQAHARGLELHAWFNPYRAGFAGWKEIPASHVIKSKPHLVRRYGSYYWLDPAEKEVQDYTTRVILDVVRRYDIDGVHLDDYFYPYPAKDKAGKFVDFPDEPAWKKYRSGGGQLTRNDWRRESVNTLVQRLQREIQLAKPWVTFGISPFGIWRPGHPPQIKGLDAYDAIYADARLWLVNGWVDYLAPQLYWPIDQKPQSFTVLLDWWHSQNERNIRIWPGGSVARVGNTVKGQEIIRQVQHARASQTPGYIHWNLGSLLRNKDNVGDRLRDELYQHGALVPPTRGAAAPQKPALQVQTSTPEALTVSWSLSTSEPVGFWVLQTKVDGQWQMALLPATTTSHTFPITAGNSKPEVVAVSALSRHRQLSPISLLPL